LIRGFLIIERRGTAGLSIHSTKTLGGDHDVIDQEARIGRCGVRGTGAERRHRLSRRRALRARQPRPDSDSWWNTIKNGIALAGQQMGVEVEYRNPPTGDLADMARIIEQAAASGPNGIITTLADYDVLSGPIKAAVDSGVDVIIMNSGTPEQAREVGALMYVGQPEYDAGYAAGLRAKGDGVGSLPLRQPLHLLALLDRALPGLCRRTRRRSGQPDDRFRPGSGRNQEPGLAYLNSNPDTDAVLTLGRPAPTRHCWRLRKTAWPATSTSAPSISAPTSSKAIKDGTINWGIDQQPFLQAYLPVVVLTNYHRYGVLPGNNINSGPGFVTADGLEMVEKYAGEYR
jgi:simple sugar transport system substrate-binding protein